MASRLRIARLEAAPYVAVGPELAPEPEVHRRLDALIRRFLPEVTASLLAAPAVGRDARFIEWYSDLAGQPRPLTSLPPAAQVTLRTLLQDRLASLRELADRLPQVAPESAALADTLRRALVYPGDEAVYEVGGQPVLVFWGHRTPAAAAAAAEADAAEPAPSAPAAMASAAGAGAAAAGGATSDAGESTPAGSQAEGGEDAGRRRSSRLWLAAIPLLLGLALVAAFASGLLRWPPWGPDYEALLLAAKAEEESLQQRLRERQTQLAESVATCEARRALETAQAEEQALRARVSGLEQRLAGELDLCPLRDALGAAVEEGRALTARTEALQKQVADRLEACRRQAEADRRKQEAARKKEEQAARKAEEDARRKKMEEEAQKQAAVAPPGRPQQEQPPKSAAPAPCPGERTPEQAPDVAVVLDSSGSMAYPASMNAADIQREIARQLMSQVLGPLAGGLFGGSSGPSRLEEAKKGVNSVVRGLPPDVDVGLVVLQDCPRADNLGFYSGAQRATLYRRVNSLSPQRGTPLAQGITEAGRMIDGVNAPAVMVVVSDGDDSCGGNPCAAAAALKRQKPQLTINVVDILGTGEGRCVADATGGRVLTPQDGLAFERTIKQATAQAQKPPHCP